MNLTDENILSLCDLLKNNKFVKKIILANNNEITFHSVTYLSNLINFNKNIEYINLDNLCSIDMELKNLIKDKIQENVSKIFIKLLLHTI